MKKCNDCRHAKWDTTKTGRRSPTGLGECMYKIKIPKLPPCKYFLRGTVWKIYGGTINRHEVLREHCVYYEELK